jgi:hypothetical protein
MKDDFARRNFVNAAGAAATFAALDRAGGGPVTRLWAGLPTGPLVRQQVSLDVRRPPDNHEQ